MYLDRTARESTYYSAGFGGRGYRNLEFVPTLFLGTRPVYKDTAAGAEVEEPQLCRWIQCVCEMHCACASSTTVVEHWGGGLLVFSVQ